MNRLRTIAHSILCIFITCWIGIWSVLVAHADNAPPPIMTEAGTDSMLSILTVKGANFGTNGELKLAPYGSLQLESYTSNLITADLPPGVSAGSYLLTLTVANKTEEFWVTLGAVGPQGPAGPSGLAALAGMSCPSGQAIVGFSSTGGLICAFFTTGTGGGGSGSQDTDGDGIPDASDPCPTVPNVTDNGISYCPASIYDVTGWSQSPLPAGALVALGNLQVTAVNGTMVTIAIVDGDPGYNGADGASLTIDVGSLPVPSILSRVNVFGTVLGTTQADRGLAPNDIVFVFNAACLNVACTTPPANYCDGTTLVTYTSPGTCTIVGTAGICQYATTSISSDPACSSSP